MFQWGANDRMNLCACAGWREFAHIARAQRHIFAWRDLYSKMSNKFTRERPESRTIAFLKHEKKKRWGKNNNKTKRHICNSKHTKMKNCNKRMVLKQSVDTTTVWLHTTENLALNFDAVENYKYVYGPYAFRAGSSSLSVKHYFRHKIEPAHDKTYNKTCATSVDSDQHAHPRSLIRVFADHMCFVQPPGYPKRNEW